MARNKQYKTRELIIDKSGNKRYKYTYADGRKAWGAPLKAPAPHNTVIGPFYAEGVMDKIISILQSKPVEQYTTTESEILAHLAAAGYVKLTIEKL